MKPKKLNFTLFILTTLLMLLSVFYLGVTTEGELTLLVFSVILSVMYGSKSLQIYLTETRTINLSLNSYHVYALLIWTAIFILVMALCLPLELFSVLTVSEKLIFSISFSVTILFLALSFITIYYRYRNFFAVYAFLLFLIFNIVCLIYIVPYETLYSLSLGIKVLMLYVSAALFDQYLSVFIAYFIVNRWDKEKE